MKIVVTGGAGFIGSHLCERLLSEGQSVVSIDKRAFHFTIKPSKRFKSLKIDIRDAKKIEQALNKVKPDFVIHLAAMVGVRPSMNHPKLYEAVNVKGTQNLLEACRRAGVRKFIFASSSSVYGNDSHVPFKESDTDLQPISPYAVTKKAGEALCHAYSQMYKMDICVLRFFTVYGPRQRTDLAIYKFTKLLYENKPIPFYGDGSSERDYTYIDDILGGVLKAVKWTIKGAPRGRFDIFNLGGSRTISLKALVKSLEKLTGKKAKLKKMPEQPGDVRRTYADISKAEKVLGYAPQMGLEKGLKTFVEWYKTKHSRHSLSGLLKNISNDNLHAEVDMGRSQGREIW